MSQLTAEFLAASTNFYVDQGSDFSKLIDLIGPDGTPIDLTGYKATCSLKLYHGTNKDYGLQAEVYADPLNGQIRVYMSARNTILLTENSYVYSVKLAGTVTVHALMGNIFVTRTV